MKNFTVFFLVFIMFGSCAKQEEIVLEGKVDTSKDYFPVEENRTFNMESLNNEDDQYLHVNSNENYSYFSRIGDIGLDKSYLFGPLGGTYDSYEEEVSLQRVNEDIKLRITEEHSNVYPSYSSSYYYKVSISPYELHLLKANLTLNQTWTSTQSITTSYEEWYSYYPSIADETSNSVFNFKVIEFNESRTIDGVNFSNIITIRVIYNIGSKNNLTRTYSFAEGFGLVAFSIQDKSFLLEN